MTSAILLMVGILIGAVASYIFHNTIRKELLFLQSEQEAVKKQLEAFEQRIKQI